MNSNPATLRIKNVLALSSGEFISSLISFAAIAYLAGTLGPEKFGILGFATAIVSFFSLFVDTGFADVGSRDVAPLTDRVLVETDQAKRTALIHQAWTITTGDIAYIPLHQQAVAWGVGDRVTVEQRADNQFAWRHARVVK